MASVRFSCPQCGFLQDTSVQTANCTNCGHAYLADGNVYNLVSGATDRKHEQAFYDAAYENRGATRPRSIEESVSLWDKRHQPELAVVRDAVGNVSGLDVLLLGNGASEKELAFLLQRPRTLVYSDLSVQASLKIQARYSFDEFRDRMLFAAVDAQSIPFADESFDVVYGFAFVHHLPDVAGFIRQVHRILRPGGHAVFMDDAYAPIWHKAKQSVLKPLMRYSHRTSGISPEDYRFSMSGGFREKDLAEMIVATGAEPWFRRISLITFLVFRAAEKLLPATASRRLQSSHVPDVTCATDRALARLSLFRNNQIRLIWGFSRPGRSS